MVGLRGIPARYGGVETVVETLSAGLADAGHSVTVYCWRRPGVPPVTWHGKVRLRHLRTVGASAVGSFLHSIASTIDASRREFDVIHYHALGPGIVAILGRLICRDAWIVVTVHGRDDQRIKWGPFVRKVLEFGVWVSARVPHRTLVVSNELARDFAENHRRPTLVAPNAIDPIEPVPASGLLDQLGLVAGNYAVSVGRLVPEKAAHRMISAFAEVPGDMKLVIIGGSSGTDGYVDLLEQMALSDDRVVLVGQRYGDELAELLTSASMFVTASDLEGLPTALLEAVMAEIPVVATDIEPHKEVLGWDGPGHRLVPAGDDAAITAAIKETAGGMAMAKGEIRQLARVVRKNFSLGKAVELHERAYRMQA